MGVEPLEPLQLVVELRPRGRVAVGQVEAADGDAAHDGLDVAAVGVVGVARQAAAGLLGLLARARMATPFQAFWPCQTAS